MAQVGARRDEAMDLTPHELVERAIDEVACVAANIKCRFWSRAQCGRALAISPFGAA